MSEKIPDAAPIFEEPPEYRYGRFCLHDAYAVIAEQRRIVCKACKAVLDPFEILERRALRQSSSVNIAEETRKRRANLAALIEEEKRVKARLRNARKKDADAAVALERKKAKENHGRAIFHLLCIQKEIETALRQLGHEDPNGEDDEG